MLTRRAMTKTSRADLLWSGGREVWVRSSCRMSWRCGHLPPLAPHSYRWNEAQRRAADGGKCDGCSRTARKPSGSRTRSTSRTAESTRMESTWRVGGGSSTPAPSWNATGEDGSAFEALQHRLLRLLFFELSGPSSDLWAEALEAPFARPECTGIGGRSLCSMGSHRGDRYGHDPCCSSPLGRSRGCGCVLVERVDEPPPSQG